MLDAGINKISPTTFVNIGLQNGVLLRTVLDPINGQLTDTRTRYVNLCPQAVILAYYGIQFLGHATDPTHPRCDSTKPRYPRFVLAFMAQLHLPKSHALYPAHLRKP